MNSKRKMFCPRGNYTSTCLGFFKSCTFFYLYLRTFRGKGVHEPLQMVPVTVQRVKDTVNPRLIGSADCSCFLRHSVITRLALKAHYQTTTPWGLWAAWSPQKVTTQGKWQERQFSYGLQESRDDDSLNTMPWNVQTPVLLGRYLIIWTSKVYPFWANTQLVKKNVVPKYSREASEEGEFHSCSTVDILAELHKASLLHSQGWGLARKAAEGMSSHSRARARGGRTVVCCRHTTRDSVLLKQEGWFEETV